MIWATDSIGLSTLLFPPQHALDYLEQNPIHLALATNREHLPPKPPFCPAIQTLHLFQC